MKNRVKIIAFTYPYQAHLAQSYLESFDIEVILQDELTVQNYNFYSNAIGGVKLFVEKDKVEEALLLLEQAGYIEKKHPKQESVVFSSSEYKTICPYCKSSNIRVKDLPGYVFVISILLLGFPLAFLKKLHYCYDCSKEWKMR